VKQTADHVLNRLFIGRFCLKGWLLVADERRFATEESLKEIHRVLRLGAAFGMIWNIDDCVSSLPNSQLDY
jgi:hypothetical protein